MRNRRKNTGNALAGTMMFLLLVMIMWLGVTRQMGTYLRMEKNFQAQNTYYDCCIRASSWGLALLETGVPPSNPYSCRLQVGQDTLRTFVLTFELTSPDNYRITARPAVSEDDSLPDVPPTFASGT
jgi:hypothetical protein